MEKFRDEEVATCHNNDQFACNGICKFILLSPLEAFVVIRRTEDDFSLIRLLFIVQSFIFFHEMQVLFILFCRYSLFLQKSRIFAVN